MTRKKPWNRVNLPVYSICSSSGTSFNMNMITYASQISMQPKRYLCGIYTGTQTLENVEKHGTFILQILSSEQYKLIDLLGKKSGKQVDKIKRLQKRNELMMWNEFPVLKNAIALMKLNVINSMPCGDHHGFLCDVTDYKNLQDGFPLTLDILREKKLIRI